LVSLKFGTGSRQWPLRLAGGVSASYPAIPVDTSLNTSNNARATRRSVGGRVVGISPARIGNANGSIGVVIEVGMISRGHGYRRVRHPDSDGNKTKMFEGRTEVGAREIKRLRSVRVRTPFDAPKNEAKSN
jgi:hypothetical protein